MTPVVRAAATQIGPTQRADPRAHMLHRMPKLLDEAAEPGAFGVSRACLHGMPEPIVYRKNHHRTLQSNEASMIDAARDKPASGASEFERTRLDYVDVITRSKKGNTE